MCVRVSVRKYNCVQLCQVRACVCVPLFIYFDSSRLLLCILIMARFWGARVRGVYVVRGWDGLMDGRIEYVLM